MSAPCPLTCSFASYDSVGSLYWKGLINPSGSLFYNYTHRWNNYLKQEDSCVHLTGGRIVCEFHYFPSLLFFFFVPRSINSYWMAEADIFRCISRTFHWTPTPLSLQQLMIVILVLWGFEIWEWKKCLFKTSCPLCKPSEMPSRQ